MKRHAELLSLTIAFLTIFPLSASALEQIRHFTLLNPQSLRPIQNFQPLQSDALVSMSEYSATSLAVRADISRRAASGVKFRLIDPKGRVTASVDHQYPFIFRWKTKNRLVPGRYALSASPIKPQRSSLRGYASRSISFTMKDTQPMPQLPIPHLQEWQDNMVAYGRTHCAHLKDGTLSFDAHLAATYYDAEWVFYQIGDYTKDTSWYECAHQAQAVYRDQYVLPNNGAVPGYWNFSHGMLRDYLSTGDSRSQQGVALLAQNGSYAPDTTPLAWTQDASMSREVAYAIMAYLNAEHAGQPHRTRTEQLLEQALGHTQQWFTRRTADYVRPFMFSLTAHALITYSTQINADPRILPAIKTGADWIWEHMWISEKQAFQYTDRTTPTGGVEAAPDLNLLIAPVYAWLWNQTGDTTYRDRADQIFSGGVTGAWLINGKQFNQSYRWSFEYIRLRSIEPVR